MVVVELLFIYIYIYLENRLIHKFLLKGDLIHNLGVCLSCFHLFDCFLANRAKTGIRAVSGSHYGYASPSPVQTFGFNTSRVNDSSASFQLNAPCPRCLHGFPFQRLLTLTFGGHPLTFHGGCSFQAT